MVLSFQAQDVGIYAEVTNILEITFNQPLAGHKQDGSTTLMELPGGSWKI